LSFGLADLSAELGFNPTWEVLHPYRSLLVASGAQNAVVPIDTPFLDIKDPDGLVSECRQVRAMGYAGKLCIHPSQLEIVNEAFTPTEQEIRQARRIVSSSENQADGAIVIDGRMVDKPVVDKARRTVDMAVRLDL
jgi:citrate lyase beta subunit